MPRVLIVGGGYAGFYTAWHLEKKLRRGEAEITVVDPRPYMTYQPFLPEVTAGSVEARHAAVSLRRHLRRSDDHRRRGDRDRPRAPAGDRATADGGLQVLGYDVIVVTAGAVTRTFPSRGSRSRPSG